MIFSQQLAARQCQTRRYYAWIYGVPAETRPARRSLGVGGDDPDKIGAGYFMGEEEVGCARRFSLQGVRGRGWGGRCTELICESVAHSIINLIDHFYLRGLTPILEAK